MTTWLQWLGVPGAVVGLYASLGMRELFCESVFNTAVTIHFTLTPEEENYVVLRVRHPGHKPWEALYQLPVHKGVVGNFTVIMQMVSDPLYKND